MQTIIGSNLLVQLDGTQNIGSPDVGTSRSRDVDASFPSVRRLSMVRFVSSIRRGGRGLPTGVAGMATLVNAGRELPQGVGEFCRLYTDTIRAHCPGLIDAVVVVGSACSGDFVEGRSDLDLVTIMSRPPRPGDVDKLAEVHRELPRGPLLDVMYVPASVLPEQPVDRTDLPHCVAGQFIAEGKSCLVSPALWAEVRRAAPAALDVGPPVEVDVMRAHGRANLAAYWQPLLANSRAALASRAADRPVSGAMIAWLILGVGRTWHTAVHGRLVTKSDVAPVVAEVFPVHEDLVVRALGWRAGRDSSPFFASDAVEAATLAQNLIDGGV
jgi:hypothetical protein